jgi:hypothetical protein
MNTKIYKKIGQILRITEVKDDEGYIDDYVVETRNSKNEPWKNVFSSRALKKVLVKKHFYTHFAIRHLGYGPVYLKRQKIRRDLPAK